MFLLSFFWWCFCFNDTATTEIYTFWPTLSLHDALPISVEHDHARVLRVEPVAGALGAGRTVAGQRERHRPVRAEHAALARRVLELLQVLVVAGRRRDQHEIGRAHV